MSDHNSPSSTGSSSPASNASPVLTPRRKVQALLAQFSDSETDNGSPLKSILPKPTTQTPNSSEDTENAEDEKISRPSRMAARLAGGNHNYPAAAGRAALPKNGAASGSSAAESPQVSKTNVERPSHLDSSEDEVVPAAHHRRLLTKRKSSPVHHIESPKKVSRSESPLFFSSPVSSGSSKISTSAHTTMTNSTSHAEAAEKGRSRFLALVEKQRRERVAREAAEIAAEAAGNHESSPERPKKRMPRGSSPADDSEEVSNSDDNGAISRISKEARPTRKASKKALEEMNRETQRMSRNMQLAHQARTKKKLTKESFLGRFNVRPSVDTVLQPKILVRSNSSSSVVASDADSPKEHGTPPTSPLEAPMSKNMFNSVQIDLEAFEMHGALAAGDETTTQPDKTTQQSLEQGRRLLQEYVKNNRTISSPTLNPGELLVDSETIPPQDVSTNRAQPVRMSLVRQFKPPQAGLDSDSDSEIEIVTAKGSKRKYAVFESLPRRKAQETSSHLALRSLAHLVAMNDKKKSMNTAEMEASLRLKARVQALQERQQRLDELKARGIIVQTAEEREQDQQQVEDLVERARQEAVEIQRREKERAKKDGTYVKDNLDDDEDFSDDEGSDEEDDEALEDDDDSEDENEHSENQGLIDGEVEDADSDDEAQQSENEAKGQEERVSKADEPLLQTTTALTLPRMPRRALVVVDDDDEDEEANVPWGKDGPSPELPPAAKTPQSVSRSARKAIPGLQMSDDLPMGLSQAFAATMADSQCQGFAETPMQDSVDLTAGLPSPAFAPVASLRRLDSIDIISDSQPASQTQPLDVNLSFAQSQTVPESPARGLGISGTQYTPSHAGFDLTQDGGYILSPFKGSRFEETPAQDLPQSTVETMILPSEVENSPLVQRQGRLRRGRLNEDADDGTIVERDTAYQVMQQAARRMVVEQPFDKTRSDARGHFDEAAEESEDEYAGLGGASDDDGDDVENEDDRRMIDEEIQVGRGEEAKLAGFYADRERERDEKDVSRLLKDITTGALRRKRGVGDELDLSDEEDEVARRREAKRREFARMRRELLKDEAVGKIAEDKKKEAFLKSIEDREANDDDDDDDGFDQPESQVESQEQSLANKAESGVVNSQETSQASHSRNRPLDRASESQLNKLPPTLRRINASHHRKPTNLAEIRESVSFLIDEPDSQAATIDLGLSDSEDEPEAYVNLDRHFKEAENDENDLEDEAEDLGDFIVDDKAQDTFKKPDMPRKDRAPYYERRTTRTDVIDRLGLSRQSSSSTSSNASTKMAFFSSKAGPEFSGVPNLLRRATTNSSIGSVTGRDNISATGVTTNKTERGSAGVEKEFVRKGSNGRRNAVNYQARTTLKEEKMSARAGIAKKGQKKAGKGFLGGLFRGDSWA